MAIDPRHMMSLLSIAERGSFSAAAVALNTSQPALSNRIALLERELGTKVFDRGRHGVSLTEAGRLLLRHAKIVDATLSQASKEFDLAVRGKEGSLRVGATPVTVYELVPRALALLSPAKISVSVTDGLDELLMEKLRAGELDLVVGTLGFNGEPSDLVQEGLLRLPFAVAVGRKNALANRRAISLKDIADVRWALPPAGGAYRRYIEAIFLSNGVPFPRDAWTFDSSIALKAAVIHADCAAMIPRHVLRAEEGAGLLRCIRLSDPSPERPIGLIHMRSRPRSPITERFCDALRVVATSIE